VRLLVQPGDGVMPLVEGIQGAKKTVEIVIFRFDRGEVERALKEAVERGVFVHALVAHTNRGGDKSLRKLEMRLLDYGVTVVRTADDLIRYHDKLMIIDRRVLHLMAFNFSYADVEHSRSFGIITRNHKLIQEAAKLFEADTKRKPYQAGLNTFLVSPVNARTLLAAFIRKSRKQLLIYDPKISDPAMMRLLQDLARGGVEIKVIGRLARQDGKVDVRQLSRLRLHTRTMIRDGREAFIGSQSLRQIELDSRREVGIIFRNTHVVNRLMKTFEEDWAQSEALATAVETDRMTVGKAAKMVVKAITKELPPVAPVVQDAVKEVVGEKVRVDLNSREVEDSLKDAVKAAVTEVVREAVNEVMDEKEIENNK
jgi:phosphatidylserine/phosphatidylglycerophosphate/cardiolipin synthase-like enzyme